MPSGIAEAVRRQVARHARGHGRVGGSLHPLDEVEHAHAAPRAEVHGHAAALLGVLWVRCGFETAQLSERGQVPQGQVHYVDVVAHARPIGRIVVAAEHRQLLAPPHADLCDEGHEIIGNTLRVLSD